MYMEHCVLNNFLVSAGQKTSTANGNRTNNLILTCADILTPTSTTVRLLSLYQWYCVPQLEFHFLNLVSVLHTYVGDEELHSFM